MAKGQRVYNAYIKIADAECPSQSLFHPYYFYLSVEHDKVSLVLTGGGGGNCHPKSVLRHLDPRQDVQLSHQA